MTLGKATVSRALVLALGCAAFLLPLAGCSSDSAIQDEHREQGRLRLGLAAEVDGDRYVLVARFAIMGPQNTFIDSIAEASTISRTLVAGSYSVELQPGFTVFRETPVAFIPVPSILESPAVQFIDIQGGRTTSLSYAFSVEGATVKFEAQG